MANDKISIKRLNKITVSVIIKTNWIVYREVFPNRDSNKNNQIFIFFFFFLSMVFQSDSVLSLFATLSSITTVSTRERKPFELNSSNKGLKIKHTKNLDKHRYFFSSNTFVTKINSRALYEKTIRKQWNTYNVTS